MRVFINDIRKWQNEFQVDLKKPSTLSNRDLQSYHIACSQIIEWASALEKVANNICDSCGKIEKEYQVVLGKYQLLPITMKGDKPVPAHEYLHVVDELYAKLKGEIHGI